VVSETPDTRLPDALGYSLLNGDGHINIFLDRVEKTKYPGYVMAYAMVHEIKHVLQGVSRHSDTGVMKTRWDFEDSCQMRLRHVLFASKDVALICSIALTALASRRSTRCMSGRGRKIPMARS